MKPSLLTITGLAALALAAPRSSAAVSPPVPQYWLGSTFGGLKVSHHFGSSFIYGDCTIGEGEEGCVPPIEVQNASICERNPLEIDLRPKSIQRRRGVPVVSYGDRIEVLTGTTDAVVFLDGAPAAAVRALRGYHRAKRSKLPAARLPRWVLEELRLVQQSRAALGDGQRLQRRLGISAAGVRERLSLTRALGPDALRNVSAATVTPRQTIRDRRQYLAATEIGYQSLGRADRQRARRHAARIAAC